MATPRRPTSLARSQREKHPEREGIRLSLSPGDEARFDEAIRAATRSLWQQIAESRARNSLH